MKKNFLLLFLMALLPLAGWAQTAEFGDVSLGKYTYGGATAPAPLVKDSEGFILTEGTHYTVTDGIFSDENCTKSVALDAKLKTDGTKYYRQVVGKVGSAYEGQKASAYFKVEKAKITLTYEANALDRTYGQDPVALNASKFSASGMKFGQTWGDGAATDIRKGSAPTGYSTADNNAGTNKKVTFVGGWTADNYEIEYDVKLTIAPKSIAGCTITAEQGDVVYTGNAITGVYTVKDGETTLVAGKDYTVSKVINVTANYKPTITGKGNYDNTTYITAAVGFAVTPAPITVSIDPLEVTYTSADQKDQSSNPKLKFNYSGIVGADVANAATIKSNFTKPTSVKVASDAKNAGEYTLDITGGDTGTETNYKFVTYLPGKLTIKPIELNIKAKPANKALGAADPTFVLDETLYTTVTGYKVEGVTFTRAAGEEIGAYDITPDVSKATVKKDKTDDTKNYTFKIVEPKAKLTIGKGGIVVTIKDAEKFYGQKDPEFEYTVTGLQGSDKLGDFTIVRDKAGKAEGEKVGGYSLTATIANPDEAKYTSLTVVPGILTIKKAQLTFTMPAQNVAIGATVTALKKDNIKVEGINNSDDAKTLYDLSLVGSTASNATLPTGYKATLTTEAQKSYEIITNATTNPVTTGNEISGKLIVGDGTGGTLTLTSINADYAAFAAKAGEKVNVTLTINPRNAREVPAGTVHKWAAQTWNAMVLPFEVSVADLSQALGYAIVNRVDAANTTEGNVQFKLEMDKIPANEPFCVKTAKAIANDQTITLNNVTIVDGGKAPSVDAGKGYKFVGAYQTVTITKDNPTYSFLRGDNAKWARITNPSSTNTWDIVPFDAYVDLTGADASREITFTFQELDGSVTAIKAVEASVDSANGVKEGWYNLSGMKLEGAPTQKGVYINNGKKVVIK